MELRHLRYFIAVAELRSVRAASEQLHVTQPAISRQIQDLEDAIGAALFERTPRGLKLTAAGTAYLDEARDILTRVDAANRLARRIADGVHGQLRLGFVENAAWIGIVSQAFSAFQQTAPDVALELTPMNTPEQFEAIAAGQLDGGFCYRLGTLPQSIAGVPVLEQNVVLAVPQSWSPYCYVARSTEWLPAQSRWASEASRAMQSPGSTRANVRMHMTVPSPRNGMFSGAAQGRCGSKSRPAS